MPCHRLFSTAHSPILIELLSLGRPPCSCPWVVVAPRARRLGHAPPPDPPPDVQLATRDAMHRKMDSVIQQLLARNARLIIVCNEGDATMDKYMARDDCRLVRVPQTVDALQPVVNVVPLQLLSYHLTTIRCVCVCVYVYVYVYVCVCAVLFWTRPAAFAAAVKPASAVVGWWEQARLGADRIHPPAQRLTGLVSIVPTRTAECPLYALSAAG